MQHLHVINRNIPHDRLIQGLGNSIKQVWWSEAPLMSLGIFKESLVILPISFAYFWLLNLMTWPFPMILGACFIFLEDRLQLWHQVDSKLRFAVYLIVSLAILYLNVQGFPNLAFNCRFTFPFDLEWVPWGAVLVARLHKVGQLDDHLKPVWKQLQTRYNSDIRLGMKCV